jgi:hypothetical protein
MTDTQTTVSLHTGVLDLHEEKEGEDTQIVIEKGISLRAIEAGATPLILAHLPIALLFSRDSQ